MWWYLALDIAIWATGGLLFWKAFESWQGINRQNLAEISKEVPFEK